MLSQVEHRKLPHDSRSQLIILKIPYEEDTSSLSFTFRASCPQAASISSPIVYLMVDGTHADSSTF